MTFSEFAKALYPFCNEGETEWEFVCHIIDKIMDGHPGRPHIDGTYQNPMRSKDSRTLLNYFSGARSISKKDASTIYSSIKLEKFEKYINRRCSREAQLYLLDELLKIKGAKEEIESIGKKQLTPEICTQLFNKILYDLATR